MKIKGLKNLRDMGGIALADGKVTRHGLILRSDSLHAVTADDCERLRTDVRLATVIDLRTPLEVDEKPDAIIEGVEYVHIPVFREKAIGITKETGSDIGRYIKHTWNRKAIHAAIPDMEKVYSGVMADKYCVEQICRVLHIIIHNAVEGKATLFHCSQGKDRAGAVSALVLALLGADRRTVEKDYEMGGRAYRFKALKDAVLITLFKWCPGDAITVYHADKAEPRFIRAAFRTIEERWGDVLTMFRTEMGISDILRRQFIAAATV